MLIGLDISSADDPKVYNRRAEYKANNYNIGRIYPRILEDCIC
jgi:hypothetical protein